MLGNPSPAQNIKGKLMPEIIIDPKEAMATHFNFDHLIWQIVKTTKPEKTNSIEWYSNNSISDKIKELWELIK